LLVDTHCWLWLQASPQRLSRSTLRDLADPRNELMFSAASSWEIALKYALGKLALPAPPAEYVPSRMVKSGTRSLAVEHAHALRVAVLPRHHRDPFDRLLIAQAQLEGLTIVTVDREFERYEVKIRFGDL
jgi:PIN domain nuclease of toxin-antitoxin system